MFSHGLHSSLCSPTECTEYTEPSCCIFSHRLHRFTQNLLAVYSPTDCTDLHRTFLLYVLPRNSRNTQNLLAVCSPTEFTEYTEPSCSIFSHGIHGIHRTFLQYVLPQISQIYTEPSCCIFSHGLHRFSQMLLSGGALVSSAPTRSVGVLLALLVHLRQVHPLKEPICVDL